MTTLEKAARPIHIAPLETGNGLLPPALAIDFDLLTHVGTILKTLGHPVRLQTIQYLALGEQRVSHIQAHIGLSQPATSQQLRIWPTVPSWTVSGKETWSTTGWPTILSGRFWIVWKP